MVLRIEQDVLSVDLGVNHASSLRAYSTMETLCAVAFAARSSKKTIGLQERKNSISHTIKLINASTV